MTGGDPLIGFFTDPTYDLPLVLAVVVAVGLGWWAYSRMSVPPRLVAYSLRKPWMERPDSMAYVTLQNGRKLPTVLYLYGRFAALLWEGYHVRLEEFSAGGRPHRVPVLPPPLTMEVVVRDLTRAYRSAYKAEGPSMINQWWPWIRERRQRHSAQDFAVATAELSVVLPALGAV
ncbi:MAG: hypothetical protein WA761_05320 [Thermoplasmata archaeon]